ncbi:MAG: hypothetical protein K2W96_25925 [Gemmataceae bacterium]|nr:hypothetical protein [Gemmataceae bacterium]
MGRDGFDIALKPRPLALFGLLYSGMATNAVNGLVCPGYFIRVMGWHGIADVWSASIAQGFAEGLGVSFLVSLFFTVGTGLITGAACSYGFAVRHLFYVVAGALAFWMLGGLAAVGLAAFSPGFYRSTFGGMPLAPEELLSYAWVGGSIIGVEWGGGASAILGMVLVRANWRRESAARLS